VSLVNAAVSAHTRTVLLGAEKTPLLPQVADCPALGRGPSAVRAAAENTIAGTHRSDWCPNRHPHYPK
jgi:hypothetical protein